MPDNSDEQYFTPDAVSAPSRNSYDPIIERHAARTGIDPNLVRAVIGQESTGIRTAVSPKGARGLMQLMPGTAARFGVTNVNDPEQNIRGGTDYLKFLSDRYNGNPDKILAGYNAGEGNVDKYHGVPPFAETRNYVPAVKARYQKLTGQSLAPQRPAVDPDANYFTPDTKEPEFSPDTPPTIEGIGRGAGMARAAQAPMRSVSAQPSTTLNDVTWHLGVTPDEYQTLTRAQQRKANAVAQAGVQGDIAKRAAGQTDFTQDVNYQNQNRAKAGLKPLQAGPTLAAAKLPQDSRPLGGNPMMPIDRSAQPTMDARSQIARQVEAEQGSLSGQIGMALHPIDELTKSREQVFNEEVDRRLATQERANTPEMIAERKQVGREGAVTRSLDVPVSKFAAGLGEDAAGLLRGFGMIPNKYADYVQKRAQVIGESTDSPIDESGNAVVRSLPEKVTSAVVGLGLTVAQLAILKRATGLGLGTIMATETALQNSDKPLKDRAPEIAQAYGMGKILDQHLSRPVSAALFGAPTAVQSAVGVAQGSKTMEDALLDTAVQTGAGAILGGKPAEAVEPTQTVPDAVQGQLRGGEIDSALAAREAAVKATTTASDVPAMRVADQVQGAPGIELPQTATYPDTKYPESLGVVGPTKPVEAGEESGAKLNRWQHRDFGLVTEAADQSGVRKAQVRVTDQDGNDHVIQKPKGTGAGNQIAVPVRDKPTDARAQDAEAQAKENAPFQVIDRRGQPQEETPPQQPATPEVTSPAGSATSPALVIPSGDSDLDAARQVALDNQMEIVKTPQGYSVQRQDGQLLAEARTPEDAAQRLREAIQKDTNAPDAASSLPETQPADNPPVDAAPRLTKAQIRKQATAEVQSPPEPDSPRLTKAQQRKHAAKLEAVGVDVPQEAKTYTPTTNVGDAERANAIIDKEGLDSVVERIKKGDVEEGSIRSTLTDVAQKRLVREANSATDPAEKLRLLAQSVDVTAAGLPRTTNVAQELQAMGNIDKMSVDGVIPTAQRIVSTFDPNAKLDPARAKVFVDHANELAAAKQEVADLQAKLKGGQVADAPPRPRRAQARVQKTVDYLTVKEQEALARLAARKASAPTLGSQAGSVAFPLPDILDYAQVGAAKLARGTIEKAAWTADMLAQFGEDIRPHLDDIRRESLRLFQQAKDQSKETAADRQATKATEKAGLPTTPENIAQTRQRLQDARTRKRMAQRNLEREYRDLQDEQRSKTALIATALNRNGLLSIKGFLNIAQALTGKHLMDAASSVLASPRDVTAGGMARTVAKLPEAAANFGKAFLGKDSPVMEYWGSKTSNDPRVDLAINVMSRAFGAKEAFFRTFNEEFDKQRSARTLARLDVQSGTIKRGEKSAQVEKYLNEGATPGPKAQEWIDSKAKKAARYEAAQGRITDSMVDVRTEDLSKDVPNLLGVLKEQHADRQVSADPSITTQAVRRGLNAAGSKHPLAKVLAKGVEEGFMPFMTRPVRSVADWLGSYTGGKLIFGSDVQTGDTGLSRTAKSFLAGDVYKAISSKFAPHEVEELKRTLSRTTTNAGLIMLGAVLAKKDLLDDEGKLHANGRVWNVGDIPFVGWSLTLGAGWQKKGPVGAVKSLAKVIEHHPVLRGITDLSENVLKPLVKLDPSGVDLPREAGSIAGRFVPHPLPDVAEAMSDKERTSKGFTGPILYRIPYMRDKLDPRLTALGEEIPKSRFSGLDPYRSQPDLRSKWPLSKDLEPNELQRAPVRMKDVGETDREYLQRQKTEGPFAKQALQELASDPEYYGLTKAQKRKARVRAELEGRKAAREYLPAPQRRIAAREAQ